MLRFLSIELCNWSFARRQAIPLHEWITLLVGPNGSGKTSFLDAFKLLLGSDRLYKKRNIADYMERDVEKGAIIGRFDNRPVNGNIPFGPLGLFGPLVTICCRMRLLADGKWEREYAITDGEFSIDSDERRVEWHGPKNYQERMEKVGVSKSLLRIISLNQGSTDEILQKDQEDLCRYILEISGDKQVMDRFNATREKLLKTTQDYEALENTQSAERERLKFLEGQVGHYRYLKQRKGLLEDFRWRLPVAAAAEAERECRELTENQDDLAGQTGHLNNNLERKEKELERVTWDLSQGDYQYTTARAEEYQINQQRDSLLAGKLALEPKVAELQSFIQLYEGVSPKDLPSLEKDLQAAGEGLEDAKLALRQLQRRQKDLAEQERQLDRERRIVYPQPVEEYRSALRGEKIQHLLLAECLEITDNRWRKGIESLLSRERFTVVVTEEREIIRSKKLAEKMRYRSYVQRPDPRTVKAKPGSALAKIRVLDQRVAGCLRWLNEITLVDSVEEGHHLAEAGQVTLTDQAYRQDARGGISLYREGVYCGKLALEAQLEEVRAALIALAAPLNEAQQQLETSQSRFGALEEEVKEQQALRQLPAVKERHQTLARELAQAAGRLASLEEQRQRAGDKIGRLYKANQDLAGQKSGTEQAIRSVKERITDLKQKLKTVQERLPVARQRYGEALNALVPEQKQVLEDSVERDRLRRAEEYRREIQSLEDELSRSNVKDLIGIEERYQEHRARVEFAEGAIRQKREELDLYRLENDEAQKEYADMVAEVFIQLRRHLENQAEMAGIRVKVHANRIGEAQWSLDYELSFDGKPFRPYFHKKLSGGQAVIAALLLLIAAIKVDGAFSFMILDEPTAHLDAGRMRVVGEFLRLTGAQYLLAVPYSENIKHLDWVNMTLNFRLKDEQAEIAPPVLYGIINEDYVVERTGRLW